MEHIHCLAETKKIVVRLDKIRQPHYKLSGTFDFLLNSFRVIFKSPSSCFYTPQIIPDYLLLILRKKNHIQYTLISSAVVFL